MVQPKDEYDYFLRQVYGGQAPPSLDYYRNLGTQKRQREEAERRRREAERQAKAKAEQDSLQQLIDDMTKSTPQPKQDTSKYVYGDLALKSKTTPLNPAPGLLADPYPYLNNTKTSTKKEEKGKGGLAGFFNDLGKQFKVGAKGLGQAFNPFDDVDFKQGIENAVSGTFKELENESKGSRQTKEFIDSVMEGASFGALDNKGYEDTGASKVVGNILGSIGPGGLIATGLRGTKLGANIGKNATLGQRIGQTAKEGSVAGGIYAGIEGLVAEAKDSDERDIVDHMKNIGLEMGLGAVLDPAISELGGAILRRFRRGEISKEQAMEEISVTLGPKRFDQNIRIYDQNTGRQRANMILDEVLNSGRRSANYSPQVNFNVEGVDSLRRMDNTNLGPSSSFGVGAKQVPPRNVVSNQGFEDVINMGGPVQYPLNQPPNIAGLLEDLGGVDPRVRSAQDQISQIEDMLRSRESEYQEMLGLEFRDSDEYTSTQRIINTLQQQIDEITNPTAKTKQTKVTTTRPESNLSTNVQPTDLAQNPTQGQNANDIFDEIKRIVRMSTSSQSANNPMNVLSSLEQPNIPTRTIQRNNRQVAGASSSNGARPDGLVNTYGEKNKNVEKTSKGIRRAFNELIMKLSDDIGTLKYVEDKAGGSGKAYKTSRNSFKAFSNSLKYTEDNLVKAQDIVIEAGEDLNDAWHYAYAKNLLQVLDQDPNYKLPNNMTRVDLMNKYIKPFQNNSTMNQFANEISQSFGKNSLDILLDAGIISKGAYDELLKRYPNHLPKFKDKALDNPNEFADMIAKVFNGERKPVHELEGGSDELIADPINNITKYMANVYNSAAKNKAFQQMVSSLENQKIGDVTLLKQISEKEFANSNRAIKVMYDGESQFYELTPDLMRVVTNMNGTLTPHQISDWASKVSRWMRTSITGNPAFAVRQFSRDVLEGYVYGDFSLFKDLVPAFMDSVTGGKFNPDMYQKFYNSGAGSANIFASDRAFSKAKRQLRDNKKDKSIKELTLGKLGNEAMGVLDRIQAFNQGAENVTKMAQFRKSMRKNGGDVDQASFEAADLMDYHMAGEWIRVLNRHIGFLNVNIRGKERMARALRDRPLETVTKMGVVGALPSYLAYQAYNTYASEEQKKRIDEAYQYEEDTYWLIPSPTDDKSVWRIGKPYEVALLASTPFEWYLKNQKEGVNVDMEAEREEWFSQLGIDPMLNIVTPAMEFITGVDTFTDSPIVPQREQLLDPIEQQDVSTGSIPKGIASLFNAIPGLNDTRLASPRMIEKLIEGYAPVSGENISDGFDRILEVLGVRENQKPKGSSGLENLNPFVANSNQTTSLVSKLYDTQEKVRKARKKDPEAYSNLNTVINKAVDKDGEIAGAIREIDNNPNLSREEKQQQRQALVEQRNEFAREIDKLLGQDLGKADKSVSFDKGFDSPLLNQLYEPQDLLKNSDKLKSENQWTYSLLNKAEQNDLPLDGLNEIIRERGVQEVEKQVQKYLLNPQELIMSDDEIATTYREIYTPKEIIDNAEDVYTAQGKTFPYNRIQSFFNKLYKNVSSLDSQIDSVQNDPNFSPSEREQVLQDLQAQREQAQMQADTVAYESARIGFDQMNQQLEGVVREQSQRTDNILVSQFKELGVPEYYVRRILDSDLSKEQQTKALRKLLESYQSSR